MTLLNACAMVAVMKTPTPTNVPVSDNPLITTINVDDYAMHLTFTGYSSGFALIGLVVPIIPLISISPTHEMFSVVFFVTPKNTTGVFTPHSIRVNIKNLEYAPTAIYADSGSHYVSSIFNCRDYRHQKTAIGRIKTIRIDRPYCIVLDFGNLYAPNEPFSIVGDNVLPKIDFVIKRKFTAELSSLGS